MKAYITDANFREIINQQYYGELDLYPGFNMRDFEALNGWRDVIPEYIKDYVSINKYML